MPDNFTFEQILEASPEELPRLCHRDENSLEDFYGQVILNSLRNDLPSIEKLTLKSRMYFAAHAEISHLEAACLLRLRLAQKNFDGPLVKKAEVAAAGKTKWQGELAMLVACCHLLVQDYAQSQTWFVRAIRSFEKQLCFKNALRARMKALECEGQLGPNRHLLAEYHDLYRLSLKKDRRDIDVAVTCLLSISREFQKAGSLLVALKYCNKALTLAEFQFGSLSHHLSLAQRVRLSCDLGRTSDARADAEVLKTSSFSQAVAALETLRPLLTPEKIPSRPPQPATDSRPASQDARFTLSGAEEKLVLFLAKGFRNQNDILEHLYGPRLAGEAKFKRFQNLISTLRGKAPQLIRRDQNGRYGLAEQTQITTVDSKESEVKKA